MTRGLLIIDIQNDYFPGGAYPLVAPEAAAAATARVLEAFLAALADGYAKVVGADQLVEGSTTSV